MQCTAAAGLAWGIALPSLYILNSLSGSRLRQSTTFLAALVTTSWGGLAMIASIPINWFFTAALPGIVDPGRVAGLVRLVNLVIFTGVGVAMSDVFGRVMQALEPSRGRLPLWWLAVVGAIGGELFYAFGLFQFTLPASSEGETDHGNRFHPGPIDRALDDRRFRGRELRDEGWWS